MAFVKKGSALPPEVEEDICDLPELLARLQVEDPEIRQRAAHQLVEFSSSAGELCACLRKEENVAVRNAILTTLIRLNAVSGLLPLLRVEDASLRNDVIRALQQMQEVSLPFVEKLLGDSDPDVRIYAIYILAAIQHPRVPPLLMKVIESESHINVWGAALDALAESGTAEMVPTIESSLKRFDCEYAQFAVNFAVRRILG